MRYFNCVEKANGKFAIEMCDIVYDKIIGCPIESSYNVLYARIFGLHYADFLRMVRDVYNGSLCGKTGRYICFEFADARDAKSFIKDATEKMEVFINE